MADRRPACTRRDRLALSSAVKDSGPFRGHIQAGRLQAVLEDCYRPSLGIFAIHPHSKHVSAKICAFADHLVEAFADTVP